VVGTYVYKIHTVVPHILFIYILYTVYFNDSANSSDCIASNSILLRNAVKNNNVRRVIVAHLNFPRWKEYDHKKL